MVNLTTDSFQLLFKMQIVLIDSQNSFFLIRLHIKLGNLFLNIGQKPFDRFIRDRIELLT